MIHDERCERHLRHASNCAIADPVSGVCDCHRSVDCACADRTLARKDEEIMWLRETLNAATIANVKFEALERRLALALKVVVAAKETGKRFQVLVDAGQTLLLHEALLLGELAAFENAETPDA